MFLLLKVLVSKFRKNIKFALQDSISKQLTDVLSRHFWDSNVTQWAFNNLIVSVFVLRMGHAELETHDFAKL
jgi:hypothetical protein